MDLLRLTGNLKPKFPQQPCQESGRCSRADKCGYFLSNPKCGDGDACGQESKKGGAWYV
jgi:hypothetical protein